MSQMTRNGRSGVGTGAAWGGRLMMLREGKVGGGKTPLWSCRVYFKPAWNGRTFGGSSRPTGKMRMLHNPRRTHNFLEGKYGHMDGFSTGFLFATAFPSVPTSAPRHPADVIPTLTQLLRESSSQEQRLLDGLHDVSKMSIHKHKRGVSVSRGLLLSSLHVEQPSSDNRATNRWSNRRPSPGLHSPNRYTHNVVAKRRLSYDYNRSGPE